MKLISFDIQSDFGFFRKPETNNTLNISFNMIHKPAILGLLGAIIGLKGYEKKGELPEYYQKLNHIKVGIEPLEHECGNYSKTPIKYSNTVGYANKGATFLTEELTLIAPKYRIYLLLDESIEIENNLLKNVKNQYAEFIPYLGKNEFTAWWKNYKEYEFEEILENNLSNFNIITLFLKTKHITPVLKQQRRDRQNRGDRINYFIYFERLPIDFDLDLMQYKLEEFVYTTYFIENKDSMQNLFLLKNLKKYVQLN